MVQQTTMMPQTLRILMIRRMAAMDSAAGASPRGVYLLAESLRMIMITILASVTHRTESTLVEQSHLHKNEDQKQQQTTAWASGPARRSTANHHVQAPLPRTRSRSRNASQIGRLFSMTRLPHRCWHRRHPRHRRPTPWLRAAGLVRAVQIRWPVPVDDVRAALRTRCLMVRGRPRQRPRQRPAVIQRQLHRRRLQCRLQCRSQ